MKTRFLKLWAYVLARPFESFFLLPIILFFCWYALALSGLFFPSLIAAPFLACVFLCIIFLTRHSFSLLTPYLLLGIFLTAFSFFALLSHPLEPVSEGRDQGTFVNSALLLHKYHSFHFLVSEAKIFFALSEPGKALNFPGLAFTNTGALVPEFPLGYITWLGGFFTLFGLSGLAYANALLYILSGFILFRLLQRFVNQFFALLLSLFFMGSFLPLWFVSFPLTENLALFLFLLACEGATRFASQKNFASLFLCVSALFALALTRIEGWAMLLCFFVFCLLHSPFRSKSISIITRYPKSFLSLGIAILTLTVSTFLINFPYYKAIAKALSKTAGQDLTSPMITEKALPLYVALWEYHLFIPFLFGIFAILILIAKKRIVFLLPVILGSVTFLYLIFPHITLDAPWMLRRFHFALAPILYLSLISALSLYFSRVQSRKQMYLWSGVLFFLLISGITPFQKYIESSYSDTLMSQTKALSEQFTFEDLLLVDKDVTGDNFMIPARTLSLLFNRPAVYFYNPHDYKNIETSSYKRVFLIVPEEKIHFYEEGLQQAFTPLGTFTYTNDHSFVSSTSHLLPEKKILIKKNAIIQLK